MIHNTFVHCQPAFPSPAPLQKGRRNFGCPPVCPPHRGQPFNTESTRSPPFLIRNVPESEEKNDRETQPPQTAHPRARISRSPPVFVTRALSRFRSAPHTRRTANPQSRTTQHPRGPINNHHPKERSTPPHVTPPALQIHRPPLLGFPRIRAVQVPRLIRHAILSQPGSGDQGSIR